MRRLLLITAALLIVSAIVLPIALVGSALYTERGAQFVVQHLPHRLGPVTLSIEGLRGTPANGLHVARVTVDHELVHLEFTDIDARVRLAPLLLQTIRATHVRVGSALVTVQRRTHPATPGPPSFLPRWLSVDVDDAQVGSAQLSVYNGFHLEAHELRAAAALRHSYLRLYQASTVLEGAQVAVTGTTLQATDPLGMVVRAHLDWTPPGQAPWTLDGTARGDLNALHVVAHLVSPMRADVSGQALDLTGHWHVAADVTLQSLDLHAFGANTPFGSITGHLAGTLDEHGFEAHGPLNPSGLNAGVFDVLFAGSYANHTLAARRAELHHLASGARASASGSLTFIPHGPQLDLKGEWSEFRWPLTGREAAVKSPEGSFTLAGALPYRIHVRGRASAATLPLMPVEASAILDKDSVSFDPADIDLYGGHATLSGRVAWAPAELWTINARVSNLNPQALRPDLPGTLSFAVAASGRGFTPGGEITAAISNLSGRLRGVAASGGGTLTHAGRTWGFNGVRVGLGNASIALDGQIDDRLNLQFAVTTHDMSLLAPGSRGELKTSGSIAGTFAEPSVIATAHGANIEYQGVKLAALDAEVNFNPGAQQQQSKIDLRLHKLSYLDRTVDSALFTLSGLPSAYDVRLAASATGLEGSAEAVGAYAQGTFKGQLRALSIAGSQQLHLTLERPVDLTVSLAHAQVQWLCLTGTPGSMCADADWTPTAWSSTVMANELPLQTLTAGMTPSVEYLGTISALAHASGGGSAPVQGSMRAQLANAEIDHRLASRRIEHTKIGSGTFTVLATPAVVNAQLALGDQRAGTIGGRVDVQRNAARWQDMPVSGALHAQTDEIGLVSLYVPDIDRASGHLVADLQVAGTLGAPKLSGAVKLTDGEIDVYQVNLGLKKLDLQARLTDSGIDFKGSAAAGAGTVAANGHLEWRELLPYGKFHLQGSNLRVADVPEAQIDASPDLDFNVNGHKIEVTGTVTIPYAKIQPKDITNAVRVSPDEVIVGTEVENPEERFEVMSTITLVLGDKVNIDAMGLTARLTGSVTVKSGYDAITTGTGKLSVAEGRYTAYARQLDITRGDLTFNGGPIDNPALNVRAQKQFPDVTAGVNVTGTLQQPRLSFFSDPPLPQSQVASLILAGGSLQSSGNQGNAALGQGVALLAAELGPHVGVPDVNLETDPIANETSLVLGRYLSPRLYVSYGVSLTENLNVFKMRYTLGDHWTVRVEVGTARGADLVYSIEK
jgi:translocation and assembly module TamB